MSAFLMELGSGDEAARHLVGRVMPRGRRSGSLLIGCLFGTAVLLLAGCRDNRISVYDFMEMQQNGPLPTVPPEAVPATQPSEEALRPWSEGPYRVGPEDLLTVTMPGLEAAGLPNSQTVRVNEKGQVDLPSIGAVPVAGLTLDQIEAEIQKRYSPIYTKAAHVSVQISGYKLVDVLVFGDLRSQTGQTQTVQLRRDRSSVLQALLAAGGPLEFGGRITLIPARAPDQVAVFDLSNRADLIRAARVGTIQQSDLLIVDSRASDAVYVLGLVNRPGPIPMPRAASVSALQAIGAAGGTLLAFEPHEATLMRRQPNGAVVRVKLDLDRMAQGQDPDIKLAAGDTLLVPHNTATRIEEFLAKNLVFRYGLDTTWNPWTQYYLDKSLAVQRSQSGTSAGNLFSTLGTLNQFTGGLNATPAPVVNP